MFGRLTLFSYLRVVYDDLHEWYLAQEFILVIVDILGKGQQDIEIVELVSRCHPTLNGHIEVVYGPLAQIFHPCLALVYIMVG